MKEELKHWVAAPTPDQHYRAGDCTGVYLAPGETVEWTLDDSGHAIGYVINQPGKRAKGSKSTESAAGSVMESITAPVAPTTTVDATQTVFQTQVSSG